MKIDRLIGILSILLRQDKVTAPDLAERFEVSRRTINRDIEDICKAGIPLMTTQGRNGGISIMEGYRMDKTLLTSSDMQAIFAGLRSLDSVSGTSQYRQLMDKLCGDSSGVMPDSFMRINLSSWYRSSLAPQIELLRRAAEEHHVVEFIYYSPGGERLRKLEPCLLIFQWSSWYIWGYSQERFDFRLFKLNRMSGLTDTGKAFVPREHPEYNMEPDHPFPKRLEITALFDAEMKWRLIEEYGISSFEEQKNNKLLFRFGFSDRENLFSWLLSFGDQAELLEPQDLREEFILLVRRTEEKYRKEGE